MAIPPLDSRGLLPPGVHPAELAEVAARFTYNDHRQQLWDHLLRWFPQLESCLANPPATSAWPRLVLGGSFFSDKPAPADIEATLVFPPHAPPTLLGAWIWFQLKNHILWHSTYRVDFYPTLPGANDFTAYFQYVGTKTAADKHLHPKDRRGVVEIVTW